jgi:hypothetical protein
MAKSSASTAAWPDFAHDRSGQIASAGSFRGERGAFAGFKGSCSVLGHTVKALGSDIADWLVKPSEDADLGDLK